MSEFKEEGDLLIIKDVLQYTSNDDLDHFFDDIVPRFKYVYLTVDAVDLKGQSRPDIAYGGYSPIDMARHTQKKVLWERN